MKMLQNAYGESILSRARIFDWYKSFKDGRTSLENLPHDRRPATSINEENVEKVKKIVLENRHVTEREIASELNISNGSAHSIIHNVFGHETCVCSTCSKIAHTSCLVRDYLTKILFRKHRIQLTWHRVTFLLFPKLKLPLHGKHFQSIVVIKENSKKELKAIPKAAHQKCYEDWKKRLHMCIASNGDYFQGDKINTEE
jgi:hypothetical protein